MNLDRVSSFLSGYTASMATVRGRTAAFTAPNKSGGST
jgi:hypothetical protein